MSSTMASATSATTSADRSTRRDAHGRRAAVLQRARTSGFENCQAGTSPNRMPVAPDTREVNTTTRASDATSESRGRAAGARARSTSLVQTARSKPATPPHSDENDALDEEQPREPKPSRTKRAADRELAIAARRSREQQPRDVGAGDEQHDANRAQYHARAEFATAPPDPRCSPTRRGVQPARAG